MSARAWVLSMEDRQKLILASIEAKQNAYMPYSNFPVGAALLTSEGHIIKGSNVENASYGGCICAERTAIVKAVSDGIRHFIGLAVVTNVPRPISPCGICRQVLREFCPLDMPIFMVPADYPQKQKPGDEDGDGYGEGGVKETTLRQLLPDSFGPEDLELPRKQSSDM